MPLLSKITRLAAAALCAVLLAACGDGDRPVDQRSGVYIGHASNAEQFSLKLDFDEGIATFQSLRPGAPVVEDKFSKDPSNPGTFIFNSQAGPGKTARFRHVEEMIVGNYNFGGTVRVFTASRRFAHNLEEAAGTYNNMLVAENAEGGASTLVFAGRIVNDGRLQYCLDSTIYAMDKCPLASVVNHSLTVSGDIFTATESVPGGATFSFRVAHSAGEKVIQGSGVAPDGTRIFQIGLRESAGFRSGRDFGGTVQGAWARADYTPGNYSSEGVLTDGSPSNFSGSLAMLGVQGPQGIRSYEAGKAYVMQNTQLTVVAGTAKGGSAGFMQIGIQ